MELKPRRSILGSAISALLVLVAAFAQQPQPQPKDTTLDDEITITHILGRAGVNEFNQASLLYDVLGRNLAVGARLTF